MKEIAYEAEALDEFDLALTASRTPDDFRQIVEGKLADIASGVVVHPVYAGTR